MFLFNIGMQLNAFMIVTYKMASKMAASLKQLLSIKIKIPTICLISVIEMCFFVLKTEYHLPA